MSNSSPIKLHLISLDVPYPPDYGGMVDVFFKIKHLSEQGVELYLHCFEYGRAQAQQLDALCKKVWYYPRQSGWKGLSLVHPYMMYSRRHPALLANLLSVDAPILFEGVHTTMLLDHPALSQRKKIIRNQNVEQEYFALLGKREKSLFRKLYYQMEARLLHRLESKLAAADAFFTVSQHDHDFFKNLYPQHVHEYLPSFQPYDEVVSEVGLGDFILYHGNLGHVENADAVQWLATHVFPFVKHKIVVAGKSPSKALKDLLATLPQVSLVSNPNFEDMQALISKAQMHLLPTFQESGLKLKLLNALFCGRHVVVNEAMLFGTGLQSLCHVANDAQTMIASIEELMTKPFSATEKTKRSSLLKERYNNKENAKRIIRYLAQ